MILVTGATGFIGRHLVTRLMAAGYPVRILHDSQRLGEDLPWETPPEVVSGHVLDDEALFRAVTGINVIIHLENAMWWGRPRDLERVELVGTQKLITAARAARAGRIITVSQLGAAPSSAYSLLKVKGQVEEEIRTSGLAYTIIRSGLVFGEDDVFINHIALSLRANPLFFFMPGQGEVVLHPIYIHDLVSVLERSLEAVDVVDRLIEIGGPEYITLKDLIRTVMRVTRMQRLIVSLPPYMMRWVTSVYNLLLPRTLMTPQWLDILATNRTAQLGNVFTYFGVRPRRLEDTLLTYMQSKNYWVSLMRESLRRRPKRI